MLDPPSPSLDPTAATAALILRNTDTMVRTMRCLQPSLPAPPSAPSPASPGTPLPAARANAVDDQAARGLALLWETLPLEKLRGGASAAADVDWIDRQGWCCCRRCCGCCCAASAGTNRRVGRAGRPALLQRRLRAWLGCWRCGQRGGHALGERSPRASWRESASARRKNSCGHRMFNAARLLLMPQQCTRGAQALSRGC